MGIVKGPRFRRDLVVHAVSVVLKVLLSLWVVRIYGIALNPDDFGAYLFSKRVAAFFPIIASLGANLSVIRFVPIAGTEGQPGIRTDGKALLFFGLFLQAALVGLGLLVAGSLGDLMFPQDRYQVLGVWVVLLTVSTTQHQLVFNLLTAVGRPVFANGLSLLDLVGWQIGVFFFLGTVEVESALAWQGILAIGVNTALVTTIAILLLREEETPRPNGKIRSATSQLREYIRYGLPRAAGRMVEGGFAVLIPWLIRDDLTAVSFVLLSLTLVSAGRVAAQAANLAAGPATTVLVSEGQRGPLRDGVRILVAVTLVLLPGIVFAIPFGGHIAIGWVGEEYGRAGPAIGIGLAVIPGIIVYNALKAALDILIEKPLTLYLQIASLFVFGLLFAAIQHWTDVELSAAVMLSYAVAAWLAAWFTLWYCARAVLLKLPKRWAAGGAVALVAYAGGLHLRDSIPQGNDLDILLLLAGILLAAVLAGAVIVASIMPSLRSTLLESLSRET